MKVFLVGLFLILLGTASAVNAADDEKEKPKQKTVVKEVFGTVNYVDSHYVNVAYETDEKAGVQYEIGFHIGDGIRLERLKKLSDLHRGDTVKVTFDETQEEAEVAEKDGSKQKELKIVDRQPRVISFMRPAKAAMVS